MSKEIVSQLMDCFRGSAHSLHTLTELALQALAWVKLSVGDALPEPLRASVAVKKDDKSLIQAAKQFAGHSASHEIAFKTLQTDTPAPSVLRKVLELAIQLESAGLLNDLDLADSVASINGISYMQGLPPALADLMFNLAAVAPGETVYAAWDQSAQLAARAIHRLATVHSEAPGSASMSALIGLLMGGEITVAQSDPVLAPSAVKDGKPIKFDVAISLPPMGMRYDLDVVKNDWYGRFPERTTSSGVLSIRHLLSQAKKTVVVVVPSSVLFGANAEQELRKSLLSNGQIKAVVSLPPGLLNNTAIALNVLVLTPAGGHEAVRFINAEDARFYEASSKSRSTLRNVGDLVALILGNNADPAVATVDVREILSSSGYQLQVSRYLIRDDQKKAAALMADSGSMTLGDIAETIRPVANKASSDQRMKLREVGTADLPPWGYITAADRVIEVDEDALPRLKKQFLKPNDIVITVKGTVGKVGIVGAAAVSSDMPWVVGQSAIVLRMGSAQAIDPRALTVLLRSQLGQSLIRGIVSGATIPLIQLRELSSLQLPIPSLADSAKAVDALEQEAAFQTQIDSLRAEQTHLTASLWTLE